MQCYRFSSNATEMSYALQPLLQQLRLAEKVADTDEQRQDCRYFRNLLIKAEAERTAVLAQAVDFAESQEPADQEPFQQEAAK